MEVATVQLYVQNLSVQYLCITVYRIVDTAVSYKHALQSCWDHRASMSKSLALSPGPIQKLGKGPGRTSKNSHMCCVSSFHLE